jgi:hypothetical protein
MPTLKDEMVGLLHLMEKSHRLSSTTKVHKLFAEPQPKYINCQGCRSEVASLACQALFQAKPQPKYIPGLDALELDPLLDT